MPETTTDPLAHYGFTDAHGHPLENCVEYRQMLALIDKLQNALVDAGAMIHLTHGKNAEAWVNCSQNECRAIRDALGEATARRLS